jgi:hypothetical protein
MASKEVARSLSANPFVISFKMSSDSPKFEDLANPTVCLLIGFSTFTEAMRTLPSSEEIPCAVLRVLEDGTVVHDETSGYTASGRRTPEMLLMNGRTLGMRVFVLASRMDDVSPRHRANVGHVLCAPGSCRSLTSDAVWLDMKTLKFAFLTP